MDKIKLCKDCERYRIVKISNGEKVLGCKHKCNEVNLVTGQLKVKLASYYRKEARYSDDDVCGIEAKYFTPRKSLWQRVKGWFK